MNAVQVVTMETITSNKPVIPVTGSGTVSAAAIETYSTDSTVLFNSTTATFLSLWSDSKLLYIKQYAITLSPKLHKGVFFSRLYCS